MNLLLVVLAVVTAIGTAILTTTSVAKLLVSPITNAIAELKDAVSHLGQRLEESEAKREKDIKDIWKYLAEKK